MYHTCILSLTKSSMMVASPIPTRFSSDKRMFGLSAIIYMHILIFVVIICNGILSLSFFRVSQYLLEMCSFVQFQYITCFSISESFPFWFRFFWMVYLFSLEIICVRNGSSVSNGSRAYVAWSPLNAVIWARDL